MRLVVCSMGYSGYSAACWRALAQVPGVELYVFTPETAYPYAKEVTAGLRIRIFSNVEFQDKRLVADEIAALNPETLVISGWSGGAFKALASDHRFASCRKLMAVDSMWTGTWKQILSRWVLRSFVKRLDGIIVAGERGRQFARWLGFDRNQIFTSTYGYDAAAFADCYERRLKSEWPKRFCFVGRYAPIKGLDAVLAAYTKYRAYVQSNNQIIEQSNKPSIPWEFHTFGKGELGDKLRATEGVVDHGFLQPKDLPQALIEMGAFILPSLHEPWGVALAEAAGAGLPILCSDACASGIDCVRHMYNGYVFPVNDVERIFRGMLWMHEHYGQCPEMGRRSMGYAGAYAPEVWARRWVEACGGLR